MWRSNKFLLKNMQNNKQQSRGAKQSCGTEQLLAMTKRNAEVLGTCMLHTFYYTYIYRKERRYGEDRSLPMIFVSLFQMLFNLFNNTGYFSTVLNENIKISEW